MGTLLEYLEEMARFDLVADDDTFRLWLGNGPSVHVDAACPGAGMSRRDWKLSTLREQLSGGLTTSCESCLGSKEDLLYRSSGAHLLTDDTTEWWGWVCEADATVADALPRLGRSRRLLGCVPEPLGSAVHDARTAELAALLDRVQQQALVSAAHDEELFELLVFDAADIRGRIRTGEKVVRSYAAAYLRHLGQQVTFTARAEELLDRHLAAAGELAGRPEPRPQPIPLDAAERGELLAELTQTRVWLVFLTEPASDLRHERWLALADDFCVDRPDIVRVPLVSVLGAMADTRDRFAFLDVDFPREVVESAASVAPAPEEIPALVAALTAAAA